MGNFQVALQMLCNNFSGGAGLYLQCNTGQCFALFFSPHNFPPSSSVAPVVLLDYKGHICVLIEYMRSQNEVVRKTWSIYSDNTLLVNTVFKFFMALNH